MKAIEFDLVLEQPVLISQAISGGENTTLAMDYIPGSVVRGAIIAQLIRTNKFEPVMQDLLYTSDVLFLNAYPVFSDHDDTKRMLPVPLSWRCNKNALADFYLKIFDFAIEKDSAVSQPVNPPGLFFHPCDQNGSIQIAEPQKQQNQHIMSTTRMVVKENDNKVFTYEAISAGQSFKAVILLGETELSPDKLCLKNGGILTLGRSRSANYGRCRIERISEKTDWCEVKEFDIEKTTNPTISINTIEAETEGPKSIDGTEYFTLTLLSPAIFRDQYGQPSLIPLIKLDDSTWLEPIYSFVKTMLIGGYNRKWGMPIPQVVAAKAGCVYVYKGTIPQTLKLHGSLGERTKEGFGRYAVNFLSRKMWIRQFPEPGYGILFPNIDINLQVMGQKQMSYPKAKLREKLEENLLFLNIKESPNNAQLSRLMTVANNCRKNANLTPLQTLLNGLKDNAKTQYEKARVTTGLQKREDGVPLIDWLTDLYQTPKIAPGLNELEAGRIRENDAELYVAELIEKLAKKTIKQRKKQKEA